MSLNPNSAGSDFAAAIQAQVDRQKNGEEILNPDDMAAELANVYFEYSKTATLLGADLTAGGDKSLLETAFKVVDPATMAATMSAGVCNYWTTCGVPGIPAHGGSVVQTVTIPGATVIPAMTAAITSLITDQAVTDPYVKLFETIEGVVNTIPCVIVELIPGTPPTPTPFPETIS